MDKVSFYSYARDAGLPIPQTFLVASREELEQVAKLMTFPCILKPPMRTATWEKYAPAKVIKVSSMQELFAVYERCSRGADIIMLQEWVEGTDAELYSCNCYFNAESQPVVTFISRKLRQWPPETGVSCLAEECRNDIVLQESVRLFQSVNYRGLGYVEMKRDIRTGAHYIIEPNIGRPTGRSAIAENGGVPLLYATYCDAVKKPLPPDLQQKYGHAKWIYLRRDIQSAIHYWRKGSLTLYSWIQSWRGLRKDAVFVWSDPGPFFAELLRCTSVMTRKVKRGPVRLKRFFSRPKMVTE
jgi:predicted ATP-grasp superfamily ATP-dependent carboligase